MPAPLWNAVDNKSFTVVQDLPFAPLCEWLTRAAEAVPLGLSVNLFLSRGAFGEVLVQRPRVHDILRRTLNVLAGENAVLSSDFPSFLSALTRWQAILEPWWRYPSPCHEDGSARMLIVLTALLRQLGGDGLALCLPSNAAGENIYPVFSARAESVAMMDVRGRNRLRMIHLLRQLTVCGSVCVRHRGGSLSALSESPRVLLAEAGDNGVDWLSYSVQRSLDDLCCSGDLFPLTSPQMPALLSAALYHILQSEVEGDALKSLHGLIFGYLLPRAAWQDFTKQSESILRDVCDALFTIAEKPWLAFLCSVTVDGLGTMSSASPFSSAARVQEPPYPGSVTASQVVPHSIVVLPTETGTLHPTAGSAIPLFHFGGTGCGGAGHLLLLRIDPAGEWLPADVDVYNKQTFFSYYCNDVGWSREVSQRTPFTRVSRRMFCDEDETESEDMFHIFDAACAGERRVLRCPSPILSGDGMGSSVFDDVVREVLEEWKGAGTTTLLDAKSCLQLASAVRLYCYAVQHHIKVILTPERAPPVIKMFGMRHLPMLRAAMKRCRCWPADASTEVDVATDSSVIYLVDEVQLRAYDDLLGLTCRQHHPRFPDRFVSCSPLVLCRGCLREPSTHGDCILRFKSCAYSTATQLFVRAPSVADYLLTPDMFARVGDASREASRIVVCDVMPHHSLQGEGAEAMVCRPACRTVSGAGRMLLVAPTRYQAERWELLLRKCGRALLRAFSPSQGHERGIRSECMIRAGGAFYIALARHFLTLATGLHQTMEIEVLGCTDISMFVYVLRLLASACLAVPDKLARTVITSEGVQPTSAPPLGSHARQRVWLQALLRALKPVDSSNAQLPCLHVCLESYTDMARHLLQGLTDPSASISLHTYTEEEDIARRVFCCDLFSTTNSRAVGMLTWETARNLFVEPVDGYLVAIHRSLAILTSVLMASR